MSYTHLVKCSFTNHKQYSNNGIYGNEEDENEEPVTRLSISAVYYATDKSSFGLQTTTLVWSMLRATAADDPSQTTTVKIMHVFVLCCFKQTVLCNFDSCKSLTGYMVCIS